MYANKKSNRKLVILLVALMLVIGCAIGGTLAWLIAQSNTVTNTFTVGNITITLSESKGTADPQDGNLKSFKMVPGAQIAKDPCITVNANSEKCWLFVEVEAANGVELVGSSDENDFVTYAMATGWTQLLDDEDETVAGVYYREVAASDEAQSFYVLQGEGTDEYENGYVTVLDTVTKDMMDKLAAGTLSAPTLSFKAYAIQHEGVADAFTGWTEINPPVTPTP